VAKRTQKENPIFGIVKNGTITGAFQYDQERLLSFRNGAQVAIHVQYHGARPAEAKWYVIIATAMKVGGLPWTTKESADEGLREALNMFTPVPPVVKGGKWTRERMSLHDLDDDELEEKTELLMLLIYRLTGVNPDDFKAAMPHHADKNFKTITRTPAADNAGEGGAELSPPNTSPESGAATISSDLNSPNQLADESPAASEPASTPEPAGGGEPDAMESTAPETGAPSNSSNADAQPVDIAATPAGTSGATDVPAAVLTDADKKWLRESAMLMLAAQPKHETDPALAREAHDVLMGQMKVALSLMPRTATTEARQRAQAMKDHCKAVNEGRLQLDPLLLAKWAEAGVAQITPPKPIIRDLVTGKLML